MLHSDVLLICCHIMRKLMRNTLIADFDACLGTMIQLVEYLCTRISKFSWVGPSSLPSLAASRTDTVLRYNHTGSPLSMRDSLCQVALILDLASPYVVSQLNHSPNGSLICSSLCRSQSLCFPFRVVEHSARNLTLLCQLKGDQTRFCKPHVVVDQITTQKSLVKGISHYLATTRVNEPVPEIITLCLEKLSDPDWGGSCSRILSSWLKAIGKEAAKKLGNRESKPGDKYQPISQLAEALVLAIEHAANEMTDAHFAVVSEILGVNVKLLSPVTDLGSARFLDASDYVACGVKLQLASDTVCQLDSLLRLIFEDLDRPVSVPVIETAGSAVVAVTTSDWQATPNNVFIATKVVRLIGKRVVAVRFPEVAQAQQCSGTVTLSSTNNIINEQHAVLAPQIRSVLFVVDTTDKEAEVTVTITLPAMISGVSITVTSLPVDMSPATECLVLSAWISGFAASSALTLSRCGLSESEQNSIGILQSSPLFRYGLVREQSSSGRKLSAVTSLLTPIEAVDDLPVDDNEDRLGLISLNEDTNTFLTDLAIGQGSALELDRRLRVNHTTYSDAENNAVRVSIAAVLKHNPKVLTDMAIVAASDPSAEPPHQLKDLWASVSRTIIIMLVQHKQTWHLARDDELAQCISNRAKLVLRCEYHACIENRPNFRRSSLFNMLPTCPSQSSTAFDVCTTTAPRTVAEASDEGLTKECLEFIIPQIPPPDQAIGLSDLTAPMLELPAVVRLRIDHANNQVKEITATLAQRSERALHCLAAFRFASRTASYQPDLLDLDAVPDLPQDQKNLLSNTQIRHQRHGLWSLYRSIFISMLGILCKNSLQRYSVPTQYHPLCLLEGVGHSDTHSLRTSLATICKSILSSGVTDEALTWISFEIVPSDVHWISYTELLSQLFLTIEASQGTGRFQLSVRCSKLVRKISVRIADILQNWQRWKVSISDPSECKQKLQTLLSKSVVGLRGIISSEKIIGREVTAIAFDTIATLEQYTDLTGELIQNEVTTPFLVATASHPDVDISRKAVTLSSRRLVSIIKKSIVTPNQDTLSEDLKEATLLLQTILPLLGKVQLVQLESRAVEADNCETDTDSIRQSNRESPFGFTVAIMHILKDLVTSGDVHKSKLLRQLFVSLWSFASQASSILGTLHDNNIGRETGILTCLGALTLLSGSSLLPEPDDVVEAWIGHPDHVECCGDEYCLSTGTSPHHVGYWECAKVMAFDCSDGHLLLKTVSDPQREFRSPLRCVRPPDHDTLLLSSVSYVESHHIESLIQSSNHELSPSRTHGMASLYASVIFQKAVQLAAKVVRIQKSSFKVSGAILRGLLESGCRKMDPASFLEPKTDPIAPKSCSRTLGGCTSLQQPSYRCSTCHVSNICIYCAHHCHQVQGHFVKENKGCEKFFCKCSSICCLPVESDRSQVPFELSETSLMRGLLLLQMHHRVTGLKSTSTTKVNHTDRRVPNADPFGRAKSAQSSETYFATDPVSLINISASSLKYKFEADLLSCAQRSSTVRDTIRRAMAYSPSAGDVAIFLLGDDTYVPVTVVSITDAEKVIIFTERNTLLVNYHVSKKQLRPLCDASGTVVNISSIPFVVHAALRNRCQVAVLELIKSVMSSCPETADFFAPPTGSLNLAKDCLLNVAAVLAPPVAFAACDPDVPPAFRFFIDEMPVQVAIELLRLLRHDLKMHSGNPSTVLPPSVGKIACEGNNRILIITKPCFTTRSQEVTFSYDPSGLDACYVLSNVSSQKTSEPVVFALPVLSHKVIYYKVVGKDLQSEVVPFWALSYGTESSVMYRRVALLAALILEKLSYIPLLVKVNETSRHVDPTAALAPELRNGSLMTAPSVSAFLSGDLISAVECLPSPEEVPIHDESSSVSVLSENSDDGHQISTPTLSADPSPLTSPHVRTSSPQFHTCDDAVSPRMDDEAPLRLECCRTRSASIPSAGSSPRLFAPCAAVPINTTIDVSQNTEEVPPVAVVVPDIEKVEVPSSEDSIDVASDFSPKTTSPQLLTDAELEKLLRPLQMDDLITEYQHSALCWSVGMELLKVPAGVLIGSAAGSMTFLFLKLAHLTKKVPRESATAPILSDLLKIRFNTDILRSRGTSSDEAKSLFSLSMDGSLFRLVSFLASSRRYLLSDVCSNTVENNVGGLCRFFWDKDGRRCCCSCAMLFAFEGNPPKDAVLPSSKTQGECQYQVATEFRWFTEADRSEILPTSPSYTPVFKEWQPNLTDWEQGAQWLDVLMMLLPYFNYFGDVENDSDGSCITNQQVTTRYTTVPTSWCVQDMSACLSRHHRVFETDHPCEFLDLEGEVCFPESPCFYIQFAVECQLPVGDTVILRDPSGVILSANPSSVAGKTIQVTGDKVMFELAQEPMRHLGIWCDNCSSEIVGCRYACTSCSINYCEKCIQKACHPVNHVFLRLRRPLAKSAPSLPDLYGADHIQTPLFLRGCHHDTRCDRCFSAPITGVAWKCLNCPQYHLCSNCGKVEYQFHNRNHVFLMLSRPFPRVYGTHYSPVIGFEPLYPGSYWGVYFTAYTATRPHPEKVSILRKNIENSINSSWDPSQDKQLLNVVELNYPLLGTLDEPSLALLLSPEELGGKTPYTCRFRYCLIRMLNKKTASMPSIPQPL
eukprot:TRINITY_DN3631_c0_g1_i2.p1 TRINITY_DN3631_c0_g1~~TRINITY_DN3631_c0_g1_i2.p1  ORF type:complete len:2619 (+),score=353.79 TRINITY_DN3631_c0_g1_i2:824-8680(+)